MRDIISCAIICSNNEDAKELEYILESMGVEVIKTFDNVDDTNNLLCRHNKLIDDISLLVMYNDLKKSKDTQVIKNSAEYIAIEIMQVDLNLPTIIISDSAIEYKDENTIGKINILKDDIEESLKNIINTSGIGEV